MGVAKTTVFQGAYFRRFFIPLRVERVREVANLTERKNLHTPIYGVREFVCLSVRL